MNPENGAQTMQTSTDITHSGQTLTVYTDGSGLTGIITVKGLRYAAHYVSGEARVHLINGRSSTRSPAWCARWAEGVIRAIVDTLPSEWHQAHEAMYASA